MRWRTALIAAAAAGGAIVAIWSAGSVDPALRILAKPTSASEGRTQLLSQLGKTAATGSDQVALLAEARVQTQRAPLDDAPFLVAGAIEEQLGQSEAALTLYRAALRRNPRSRGAHFMLANSAFASGRAELGFRHLAALARQTGAARPEFTKLMLAVVTDRRLAPALRRFLINDEASRDDLFSAMASVPEVAHLVLEFAPKSTTTPLWLSPLIDTLVKSQRVDQAATAWARYGGGVDPRTSNVRDATFRGGGPAPFAWSVEPNDGGEASFGPAGLDVLVFGRTSARLASQMLLLAPGRYRLHTRAPGGFGQQLQWRFVCVHSDAGQLGAFAIDRASDFDVPANCPAQLLELWSLEAERSLDSSGQISEVRLTRIVE